MDPPISPGESWKLVVYGRPTGQGSMSAVPVMRRDGTGRRVPVMGKGGMPVVNISHQKEKKLKPWRNEIAQCAIAEGWPGLGLAKLDEALFVRMRFYLARPDSHFGTGRNAGVLKDSAPLYPETTGDDIDKLARAVLDALTGIVWKDDKRVVAMPVRRRYGTPERVEITVTRPLLRTVGDLRTLFDVKPIQAVLLSDDLQLDLFDAVTKSVKAV